MINIELNPSFTVTVDEPTARLIAELAKYDQSAIFRTAQTVIGSSLSAAKIDAGAAGLIKFGRVLRQDLKRLDDAKFILTRKETDQ